MLAVTIFVALTHGSVNIPLKEIGSAQYQQILYTRFMRVCLAFVVGAGLSAGGVALQALLRNPLAEPYLLGTSSGAGLGTVAGIVLGIPFSQTPFTAFLGALLSIVLVYFFSKQGGMISVHSLILSGVIVGMWCSAIMVFITSICSQPALQGVIWYLMGSLQMYDARLLAIISVVVFAGCVILYCFSQDLNAISVGEEEALHVGVHIERVKKIVFVVTAAITGVLVAGTGTIGFVGLIIPHGMRYLVGPNHKILFPVAVLGGAIFLIWCDLVSRSLFPPLEIPIGAITAVIGVPLFMVILKRLNKGR